MFILKLFKILKFEETLFLSQKLSNSKVNVTKEIITLNYAAIKNYSDIFFLQEKNFLQTWYILKKNPTKFLIPESYFIYQHLKKKNGIHFFSEKNSSTKVIVIKDGLLIAQFHSNFSSIEKQIKALEYQYDLNVYKYINQEYASFIESGKSSIGIEEAFQLLKNSIKIPSVKSVDYNSIIDKVSKPILTMTLLVLIYNVFMLEYLKDSKSSKLDLYNELKTKTKTIKDKAHQTTTLNSKWIEIDKNMDKQISINEYNAIISSLEKSDKILHVSLNNGGFKINVSTKNTLNILNNLNKTNYFKEIKIRSSIEDKKNEGFKLIWVLGKIN